MNVSKGIMDGKVVLVTGGTGGIGKATAEGLANLGARVVAIGRDRSKGETATAEIKAKSGNEAVELMVADLSASRDPPFGKGVRGQPRPARRARKQRGRYVRETVGDRGRNRAHARGDPPRPGPADESTFPDAPTERSVAHRKRQLMGAQASEARPG